MTGMTKGVSPEEETTGKLSAAYYVYVSVDEEEQVPQAAAGLEESLRRAVAESLPGEAGCAVVRKVINAVPPAGSGYTGWTVAVTVLIDLTVWRRDLSLVDGRYAATTVRDLLADADLTATAARIDRVEMQLLVHSPA
jgi:hypothetical protein